MPWFYPKRDELAEGRFVLWTVGVCEIKQNFPILPDELVQMTAAVGRTGRGEWDRFYACLRKAKLSVISCRGIAGCENGPDRCGSEYNANVIGMCISDAVIIGSADFTGREDVPQGNLTI